MRDKAARHFNCTPRDRALFEAGIKMGTIYHQFVGIPVSRENVREVERAIEESVKVQPFVRDAKVRIDRKGIRKARGMYGYSTLTGNLLDVMVEVEYDGWLVRAKMRQITELDYPLMYVESVAPLRKGRR